jgi:2-polyprenyl-3-methyl-5-hydroxy-6-metoxy-1,4-benzoquinol methylase
MSDLDNEAEAFDSQIEERVANGHIPDLRQVQDCDYFIANSWRRAAYVQLDSGEIFDRVNEAIKRHGPDDHTPRILEVGSGPGYISLELARQGYDVTGIDVSSKVVETAQHFADIDPWKSERGELNYCAGDFFTAKQFQQGQFDAVIFIGALHHFADLNAVSDRVQWLLADDGLIVTHEPTRDRFTEGLGSFILLLQVLLSAKGGFYKDIPIPSDEETRKIEAARIVQNLMFETDEGDKVQSPNDNEAGYQEMSAMLQDHFDILEETDTYAFYHELIGGLRFDEDKNEKMAKFLRNTDACLVKSGLLPATEFFAVARKS